MKITYDPQVDALYICFTDESAQVTTQRLTEDGAVNYTAGGRIVGIEVLDASEYVSRPGAERQAIPAPRSSGSKTKPGNGGRA